MMIVYILCRKIFHCNYPKKYHIAFFYTINQSNRSVQCWALQSVEDNGLGLSMNLPQRDSCPFILLTQYLYTRESHFGRRCVIYSEISKSIKDKNSLMYGSSPPHFENHSTFSFPKRHQAF